MRLNIIFYYISKFAELYAFLFTTLFFTIIPPRYHMKRDERCVPRANPFVNAQTKFLIRAVDLVKMFSTRSLPTALSVQQIFHFVCRGPRLFV